MSVRGEYHIACEYGTLIVYVAGHDGDFWLRNDKGVFKLCSKKEACQKQLRIPFDHNLKLELLEKLLQNTGKRAMQAVAEFNCGRREILQFCINGGQPALELAKDCPALAYLIASKLLQNISPKLLPETIQDILTQKRRALLAQINWPPAEWVIKVLRKIPASQCSADMLGNIGFLLMSGNSSKIKVLRHLPVLHRVAVKFLTDEELSPYFTYSFYEAMSEISPDSSLPAGFEVFDLKQQLLEAISNGFYLPPLKSLADLKYLHERFIRWLMRADHYEEIKKVVFPAPPFLKTVIKKEAGEEFGIFPLENGAALWREGEEMNHCIAGYTEQIVNAKGSRYAYHVKLPHEPAATLLIGSAGFVWYTEELKGKHNQDASDYVELWVKKWLASQTKAFSTDTESF